MPGSTTCVLTATCFSLATALANAQGSFVPEIRAASEAPEIARRAMVPAAGLVVELVAAEPLLANPVAFDVTPNGRFYVAETFRLHQGVFDTRDHADWVDADLAARTVEDRIEMMREKLQDDLDKFRVAHERVRLLHDDDHDGVFESHVFADGFRDLAHGIASGVLFDRFSGDVWFTCIPELWRLRDTDGDFRANQRRAIHRGFGVRFNLIGHDLHGLRIGPDRRLYFSIGDRGMHVERPNMPPISYPDTGAVLRCELDGSQLEVFAAGLRNPQELAFDNLGNLFTGDNNSDGGDRARWVYVVEGGDSGWRVGYQWLKDRGPWNRDALWQPHHEGQPAWIVPPIANALHGPSGLTHYSGTGLPARYRDHFFVCDFRASPTVSGIYASRFVQSGAGFQLATEHKLVWQVCATDVEMAFDGGIYLTDWVAGWGQPLRGRILRVHDPKVSSSPEVQDTATIMRRGMRDRDVDELCNLLGHPDQRVRQDAEFALVDARASAAMLAVATLPDRRLARLHAIWGIGILARSDAAIGDQLVRLLLDGDSEIAAQVAKVLGESGCTKAGGDLVKLLKHRNSRARFFAAQALGTLGDANACDPLLELLRDNADRDPWLRHAGIRALERIGDRHALHNAVANPSPAVRRGALLALARLRDAGIATFLHDADESIQAEAARAIYRQVGDLDRTVTRALADQIMRPSSPSTEFERRALHAGRLLGDATCANQIAHFIERADAAVELRVEALEILAEWREPGARDTVVGGMRPPLREEPGCQAAADGIRRIVPSLIANGPARLAAGAARIAGDLSLVATIQSLAQLAGDRKRDGAARAAAFTALHALEFDALEQLLAKVTAEDPTPVRLTSVTLLSERAPEQAVPLLASLAANASQTERQNAMRALGTVAATAADAVVAGWLDRVIAGDAPADVHLEVVVAARARADASAFDSPIADSVRRYDAWIDGSSADPLAAFHTALAGGTPKLGRKVFFEHAGAQCIRCHAVEGLESAAGPRLDTIGTRMKPRDLLESLITPNAKIADGFDMQILTLADGSTRVGTVQRESDSEILLVDAAGQSIMIDPSEIQSRESQAVSTMPPVGQVLSAQELRDLVAWLAQYGR